MFSIEYEIRISWLELEIGVRENFNHSGETSELAGFGVLLELGLLEDVAIGV